MKKIINLITIFLLFYSCSTLRFARKHDGIDYRVKPYIDHFVKSSNGKMTYEDLEDVSIGFVDYTEGERNAAVCWPLGYLTEIDISRRWWFDMSSSLQKMELIYHELGHCVINRVHTKSKYGEDYVTRFENYLFELGILKELNDLKDGCPSSIMNPIVLDERCIIKHYNYYVDEFFNKTTYQEHIESKQYVFSTPSCTEKPTVFNNTDEWNERDQNTLERSKNTCIERYKSCLKIFVKRNFLSYQAICG